MGMFAPFKEDRTRSNFADAHAKQAMLEQRKKQMENDRKKQAWVGGALGYNALAEKAGVDPLAEGLRSMFGPSGPEQGAGSLEAAEQSGAGYLTGPEQGAGSLAAAEQSGAGYLTGAEAGAGSLAAAETGAEAAGAVGAAEAGAGSLAAAEATGMMAPVLPGAVAPAAGATAGIGTAMPYVGAAMLLYNMLNG